MTNEEKTEQPVVGELEKARELLKTGILWLSYRARDKWESDVRAFLAEGAAADSDPGTPNESRSAMDAGEKGGS